MYQITVFSGTENYTNETMSPKKENAALQNRLCENSRLSDHSDDQDSNPNSRSSSPDQLAHKKISVTSTSVFPIKSQEVPRASTTGSKPGQLDSAVEKPKIWSVAEMASSTSASKEAQERRSPSSERNSTRSKSPTLQVNTIPVRPSVSLGGPMGHHPTGMPLSSAVTPHPAHFNGLRPPWLGLSGGYPLPFHPGALAHPYLLAAAAPHVGSPMGTRPSIRSHHDLLKLQAASVHINGKFVHVSSATHTRKLNNTNILQLLR